MIKEAKALIELMRPKEWYKNLVVFLGIFFSIHLFNFNLLLKVFFSFAILCLASGAVYGINDFVDLEKDKKHPTKRKRPLPSGRINKLQAILFILFLLILSVYFSFSLNYLFGLGILIFLLSSLIYTLFLKNIFLLDIIVISINFFLRAFLGAVVIGVVPSLWLIMGTFMLALFLALVKRKGELNILEKKAKEHRSVLQFYNKNIIDHLIHFTLFSIFVCYLMYSIIAKADSLMILTVPVATYLIFRLYFVILRDKFISGPQDILKDRGIIIGSIIFFILMMVILYY